MHPKNAVWITGASSGIGKATAKLLAQEGFFVIASARREELLQKLFGKKKNVLTLPLDISDFNAISEIFQKIDKEFFIDCLINNAGVTTFKSFAETSWTETEKIIRTNLLGTMAITKTVLPRMISKRKGKIINILSVASEKIFENSSVYSASKSGLKAFAQVIREELRTSGIKVINIYPGATATPIWPEDILQKFAGQMLPEEKIAEIILRICKDNSDLVEEEIVLRHIAGDLK